MKPCFADTFFFLAWWNRRDSAHDRVKEFLGGYSGWVLTGIFGHAGFKALRA